MINHEQQSNNIEALKILNFPHTVEDLVGNFSEHLENKVQGAGGWINIKNFEHLEGLKKFLEQLRVIEADLSVDQVQILLEGNSIEGTFGNRLLIHKCFIRKNQISDCDEFSDSYEFALLIEMKSQDEKNWIILDPNCFQNELSKGAALSILRGDNENGYKISPLLTYDAFKSIFADEQEDSEYWSINSFLYEGATQGAEIFWNKKYEEQAPIEIDYESLRQDPKNPFALLARHSNGLLRANFELSEDGQVLASYDFNAKLGI